MYLSILLLNDSEALAMPIHRPHHGGESILQHKSRRLIQPGYGIGSLFSAFKRWIVPAAKGVLTNIGKVGKKIMSNPTVREVAKVAKDEAMKVVTDVAAAAIAGDSVKDTVSTGIANARPRVAEAVRRIRPIDDNEDEQSGSGRKRIKREKKERVYNDIFTI